MMIFMMLEVVSLHNDDITYGQFLHVLFSR